MTRKMQMNSLETLMAPFVNRDVSQLKEDSNAHVANRLRQSKFYMLGARARTSFVNWRWDESTLYLEIQVGGKIVDSGEINTEKFEGLPELENLNFRVDDDKVIIIPDPNSNRALIWLTPDSIYWKLARGAKYISGFTRFKEVCSYDLLYVGISKAQDSYTRLIQRAHEKRLQILTEEPQRFPGAHISDEIILFLYDIKPQRFLRSDQMSSDGVFDDFFNFGNEDLIRTVADAEKAFVNLLRPKYNDEKYLAYPNGRDGLRDEGLDAYCYMINENFLFNAPAYRFKGRRSMYGDNRQDMILVEGERVELHFGGETREGLEPQRVEIIKAG